MTDDEPVFSTSSVAAAVEARVQALEDRANALARLAETQQRINKRVLSIRTTTGLIAIGGWVTALVALAQR